MKQKLDYNLKWHEYFQIDENIDSGLVRIRDECPVGYRKFKTNGDAVAWRLNFKGKNYYVHRIIWVLKNGFINPEMVIDHLDGNPFNNTISNLSLKSLEDNARNKRRHRNNKTGITGVRLRTMKCGRQYYLAGWYDGKQKYKYFSVDNLGDEVAKTLAIAYREDQIQKLIDDGVNYTDRHGL